MIAKGHLKCFAAVLCLLCPGWQLCGQTDEQVETVLRHLRSDDVKQNANLAANWLCRYRETLHPRLERELYNSDRQARDVIMMILMNTKGYKPDVRFLRLIIERLDEEDSYVKNHDIRFDPSVSLGVSCAHGAHWEAWKYIGVHYEIFKPMLIENLPRTRSMVVVWATVWMLKWHKDLNENIGSLTPEIFARAIQAMDNDDKRYNASQAVRFFLLLGNAGKNWLLEAREKGDRQRRFLADQTLNAMAGSRDAYGELNARLNLEQAPIGSGPEEPHWLGEKTKEAFARMGDGR